MATGDFGDLQLSLARLSGRPTADDLDDDLDLAKQVINEAYLECYLPVDGVRPPWAKKPFGVRFRAPVTAPIGVTQGSKVFTGYTPQTDTPGSVVRIGQRFYTYAGLNGSNQEFVEPVIEETGTVSATFYHNSHPLDAKAVQVHGAPELLDFGPLSPMNSRREELFHRASFSDDFQPSAGSGGQGHGFNWGWAGATYEIGQPEFYRADAASLLPDSAYAVRFVVYPVPDRICAISFEAWFLPSRLVNSTDLPRMPGDKVMELLLPIARFEWAATYKKYAGDNLDGLALKAKQARAQLRTLCTTQTHRPTRFNVKYDC